jgi:hypothetical protein
MTKLQMDFEPDDSLTMVPKIILGAGAGVAGHPNYGKGYIYKETDGLLLRYIKADGSLVQIKLGESGLEGTSSQLVDIDLYNDGMFTEYADGTIYEWTFTKDIDGKIVEIINNTTSVSTTVTWNAGDKP